MPASAAQPAPIRPPVGQPVGGPVRPQAVSPRQSERAEQQPLGTPNAKSNAKKVEPRDEGAQTQPQSEQYQARLVEARQQGKAETLTSLHEIEKAYNAIRPPSVRKYTMLAGWCSLLEAINIAIEDTGGDAWSVLLLTLFRYLILKPLDFGFWYYATHNDQKQAALLQRLGGFVATYVEHTNQRKQDIHQRTQKIRGAQMSRGAQNFSARPSAGATPRSGSARGGSGGKAQAVGSAIQQGVATANKVKGLLAAIRNPRQIDWLWLIMLTPIADNIPVGLIKTIEAYFIAKKNYHELGKELIAAARGVAEEFATTQAEYQTLFQEQNQ